MKKVYQSLNQQDCIIGAETVSTSLSPPTSGGRNCTPRTWQQMPLAAEAEAPIPSGSSFQERDRLGTHLILFSLCYTSFMDVVRRIKTCFSVQLSSSLSQSRNFTRSMLVILVRPCSVGHHFIPKAAIRDPRSAKAVRIRPEQDILWQEANSCFHSSRGAAGLCIAEDVGRKDGQSTNLHRDQFWRNMDNGHAYGCC